MKLLSALLLAAPIFAQKSLGDVYTDPDHGFQIRVPQKWSKEPLPADSKGILAKFISPKVTVNVKNPEPNSTYYTWASVVIVNIVPNPPAEAPKTDPTGAKTDAEGDKKIDEDTPEKMKERMRELEAKKTARSFEEWVKNFSGENGIRFTSAAKKGKVGKIEVEEYSFTGKGIYSFQQMDEMFYAMVYHLEDRQIALCYKMTDMPTGFKKMEDTFQQSARSFRPPDPKKVADSSSDIAKGGQPKDQRKAEELDVSRTPGWILEESKHYFIKGPKEVSVYINRALEKVEALRARFETDFPPLKTNPITAKGVIRICKERFDALHYVGQKNDPLSYCNPQTKEVVSCVESARAGVGDTSMLAHLYRAVLAQYMLQRSGDVPFHFWFIRGVGDYYGGAREVGGKIAKIDPNNWPLDSADGKADPGIFEVAKRAIRDNKFVPFESFVRMSMADYATDGFEKVSQGWALVYFLKEGKGSKGWQKDWEKILPTYLSVLTESKDAPRALEEAFKNVDFTALGSACIEYIKAL